MTHTPGVARALRDCHDCHDVVIIGAGFRGRSVHAALLAAGVCDVVILDHAPGLPANSQLRPGRVIGAAFDDDTDTWALRTADGATVCGRVVVAACPPVYVPWTPDFAGRNDFRGESFHAGAPDPAFRPAGKRIAVLGTDSNVAHWIDEWADSAASVTVFAQGPRRVVTDLARHPPQAKRWLLGRIGAKRPRRAPTIAASAIAALTPSGIRTNDGIEHPVDAVIYGTGFTIPEQTVEPTLVGTRGLTIQQAWYPGMEAFLGVAVHGFPNYFFICGPDVAAQISYVAECVDLLQRAASTRIEVLRSSQQVFNERAQLRPVQPYQPLRAFDLSAGAPEDTGIPNIPNIYDGAATLEIGGVRHAVHVRLAGHLDPIDGNYHWQGTVLDQLPRDTLKQARAGTLTVGERSAAVRVIEQTPWGTHSVAGLGAPPYADSGR
ncbi:DUF4873 domain-containing protein [Mycobacterium liflandii]|nr:DUF4873 domain-containing protein [Mycobacterium liflandii]